MKITRSLLPLPLRPSRLTRRCRRRRNHRRSSQATAAATHRRPPPPTGTTSGLSSSHPRQLGCSRSSAPWPPDPRRRQGRLLAVRVRRTGPPCVPSRAMAAPGARRHGAPDAAPPLPRPTRRDARQPIRAVVKGIFARHAGRGRLLARPPCAPPPPAPARPMAAPPPDPTPWSSRRISTPAPTRPNPRSSLAHHLLFYLLSFPHVPFADAFIPHAGRQVQRPTLAPSTSEIFLRFHLGHAGAQRASSTCTVSPTSSISWIFFLLLD